MKITKFTAGFLTASILWTAAALPFYFSRGNMEKNARNSAAIALKLVQTTMIGTQICNVIQRGSIRVSAGARDYFISVRITGA